MASYDVAIIGGGPAGLSAATSLVRQSHTAILFDDSSFRNSKSPWIHTLPTWDHRDPVEFRAAARKDLEKYGTTTFSTQKVISIKKIAGPGKPEMSALDVPNEAFELKTGDGTVITSRKVVLANGAEDVLPDIDGFADCWVKGIYHCLVCKGWEERGAPSSGILAVGDVNNAPMTLHLARQGLRHSAQVTVYTHGDAKLAAAIEAELAKAPAPISVEARRVVRLEMVSTDASDILIHLEDGTSRKETFLAHKPTTRSRARAFADQLHGLEFDPKGNVKVNPPFNQTSVRGVFAAGDVASSMQHITPALQGGTVAGAGAMSQLQADLWGQISLF